LKEDQDSKTKQQYTRIEDGRDALQELVLARGRASGGKSE